MEIPGSHRIKNVFDPSPTAPLLKNTVLPMDRFQMRYSRGGPDTGMQCAAIATTTGAKIWPEA